MADFEAPQSRIETLLLMLLEKLNDEEEPNANVGGDTTDVEHNMG